MLKVKVSEDGGGDIVTVGDGNTLSIKVGTSEISVEVTRSPSDIEYENCARVEAGDRPSSWQPMSTVLKNGKPILVRSWPAWLDEPHMPFTVYYDADLESWCDDRVDLVDFSKWAGGVESFTWHLLPE